MEQHKEILREWVGDKKELHLLSLGQLGNLSEIIDGETFITVRMGNDNKIEVNPDNYFAETMKNRKKFTVIENFLRGEMFEHLFKIRKKYGSFTIFGGILYVEQDWFDEDNTVTLNATKYSKVKMGKCGIFFIDDIIFDNYVLSKMNEVEKDDILQRIKLIFNINKHLGFSCFLKEDLIPTEEHDVCVNFDIDEPMFSITKLARNSKSILNGKIDVKGCLVNGYVVSKKSISSIIHFYNDEWEKKVMENTQDWREVVNYFHKLEHEHGLRNLTDNDIELFVQKCKEFLYDETLPRGVRKSRFEIADEMLMKLCKKIEDFSYIKHYNDLIRLN